MLNKLISLTGLFILLPVIVFAQPVALPAWSDDFERTQPGDWKAYGSNCTLEMTAETAHGGQSALRASFDDASEAAWANKGAKIEFIQPISWDEFKYLFLYYHLDRPANSIGYLLHDSAGSWWRAATDTLVTNQWAQAAVGTRAFTFAWNDDPNMPPGTKDTQIIELFIAVNTLQINSGDHYTLTLDDVTFCNALPKGLEANEEAAPDLRPALPSLEGDPFPLEWKVEQMDDRGYLLVDGKPFFPLGLYSCFGIDQASGAHGTSHFTGTVTPEKVDFWLSSIKNAGFNMLQTYTMQFYGIELAPGVTGNWQSADMLTPTTPEKQIAGMLKLLDLCQSYDLKMMAGSAPPYCAIALPTDPVEREATLAKWREQVTLSVAALKDHPALLVWYLLDEPSSIAMPVQDLQDQYRYLKELDSTHPMLVASCAASDIQYTRSLDIIAPDPYPIETGTPLREMPQRVRPLVDIATGTPPMPQTWAVIQISQWVENRRLPSPEEIRLLSLTAISQGATGLLFYEFKNYADIAPEHWANVGRTVRSLQSVIPALLAPGEVLRDVPASDKRIYSMAKQTVEEDVTTTWIIATNPSQNIAKEPMGLGEITFNLNDFNIVAGSTAVALDEDETGAFVPGSTRPVTLQPTFDGYTLTDDFAALAAHVYRITPPQ